MKELPILFSTEMVQAILAGRKSMTRRIIKPQPAAFVTSAVWKKFSSSCPEHVTEDEHIKTFLSDKCPYGKSGDLIWVRESFTVLEPEHCASMKERFVYKASCNSESDEIRRDYIKSGWPYQWKPSIHMPKEAARIWLEVTDIHVERLQDISQEDAQAEGVFPPAPHRCGGWKNELHDFKDCFRCAFKVLWNQINGPSGNTWEANPFVWCVRFKVLSTTGKPEIKTSHSIPA